ncbi:MAG TPA: VCBS repeat-containing protein, partial [Polyangiaceae bacterium]
MQRFWAGGGVLRETHVTNRRVYACTLALAVSLGCGRTPLDNEWGRSGNPDHATGGSYAANSGGMNSVTRSGSSDFGGTTTGGIATGGTTTHSTATGGIAIGGTATGGTAGRPIGTTNSHSGGTGGTSFDVAGRSSRGGGAGSGIIGTGGSSSTSGMCERGDFFGDPLFVFRSADGSTANVLSTADMNGDSFPDLLVTDNSVLYVEISTGTGRFTQETLGISPTASPIVADLNNDGRPELIVASPMGNSISEYVWSSSASRLESTSLVFPRLATPQLLATADIGGDKITD